MASFSVLTEPWIPTVDVDGGERQRGIIDTLVNAHELTAVTDPAPPIEFGLYRLLIALVLDAYRIANLDQLESILATGRFDEAKIRGYVDAVGPERFDLFDPMHPFLQSPPLSGFDETADVAVRLFQHLPSGTAPMHFYHAGEGSHAFCPKDCARALTAIAPFMTAGGQGLSPSVNGAPPWYLLVRGASLFETLVLNAYALEDRYAGGLPAWRSEVPVEPKAQRACSSLLEGLTWRPRRVRLVPEEGGACTYCGRESPVLVRRAVFTYGFRSVGGWIDPQVPYRYDSQGSTPLRPKEDRELWRDTGPLMLLRRNDYVSENGKIRFDRPHVIDQRVELIRDRAFPRERPLQVDAYGMRTDQMKVFEWYHESLTIPMSVADNPRASLLAQQALELAETVAWAIGSAIKRAYPRQASGNKKALGGVISSARAGFWAELRPRFERDFLGVLGAQLPDEIGQEEQLRQQWRSILRRLGSSAFEEAIAPLDSDAEALRRQVEARAYLANVLSFHRRRQTTPVAKGGNEADE
jgi:CRISPR system Cascade subunit CasA